MMFDAAHDVALRDVGAVVGGAWADGWTLPPRLSVSAWADAKRKIAKGAGAEPGDWHTARNPILREIMDALSDDSPARLIDFKKSAQIGATEIGINWVGYVIDRGLDSMIVAQPVKDLARAWATAKFDPAVALMPSLRRKLDNDNTLEKRFPGGSLWVIWANSSNQLRQRTARFIFMDEVDEYPDNLGDQGGADEQLAARAMSYGDRAKVYRACTPTIAGASKIDAGWLAGDQRRYYVPCPHCGAHQTLELARLQPDGSFACAAAGCLIREADKPALLRERSACATCGQVPLRTIHALRGGAPIYADTCACGSVIDPLPPDGAYWQPSNAAAEVWHRSYHAWAAYMPEGLGLSWKGIAARRVLVAANPDKQASFDNLICGEVHEGERTAQDADQVATLAEPGRVLGTVPHGGLLLTVGIDCQHDRFEIHVLAHGRGQRAHVVDYIVVPGDPSRPDGYAELDTLIDRTWTNERGHDLHIAALAIDGGNWTEMVAQWVKSKVATSGQARLVKVDGDYRRQTIYLVRGRAEKKSERAVYKPRKTEVNQRDKTIARSIGVWGVGTSVLKHIISGWLSNALAARDAAEKAGEPEDLDARMLRFPGGRGEPWDALHPDPGALSPDYYKQLTSEYFDLHAQQWIKPKGARNEAIDTAVYALWASLAPAVRIDMMRESQWTALEAKLEPPADLFAPAPPAAEPKRAHAVPVGPRREAPDNAWAPAGKARDEHHFLGLGSRR